MKRSLKSVIAVVIAATLMLFAFGCAPADTEKCTVTVIGGTGGGTVNINSTVTITATVEIGKAFASWTVDGTVVSTENPYVFKAAKDITLTANFKDGSLEPLDDVIYHTVVVDGGYVVDAEDMTQFLEGSEITIRAVVPEFFEFAYWTTDGDNCYTEDFEFAYNVFGNIKFTAVCSAVSRYELTLEGCTSVSEYISGAEFVTVTANTVDNYSFVSWTINGVTVTEGSTYTFELTEDTEVTANYKRINITVGVSTSNDLISVSLTGDTDGVFEEGEYATVKANVKNGITVTWKTSGGVTKSTSNPYTFAVTDDIELIAHFSAIYTVSVENGWIGSDTEKLTSDYFGIGAEVTVKADIPEDYMFIGWAGEDDVIISTSNPYVFSVEKDILLIAKFQELQSEATTYIFEAENADLSNCTNANGTGGNSVGDHTGVNYGSTIPDPSIYEASNGYGAQNFNNRAGNTIVWRFNSDTEATAILVVRMSNGSWATNQSSKEMNISPSNLEMSMNGVPINYTPIKIEAHDFSGTGASDNAALRLFTDYTISLSVPLNDDVNTFVMRLITIGAGPNVDCLKLTTTANLTWTPIKNGNAPIADYPWNTN